MKCKPIKLGKVFSVINFLYTNEQKTNRLMLAICWLITITGYFFMCFSLISGQADFSLSLLIVGICLSLVLNTIMELCYFLFYRSQKLIPLLKFFILTSLAVTLNFILILSNSALIPEVIIITTMISMLYFNVYVIYYALVLDSFILISLILITKIKITFNYSTYFYCGIFLLLVYLLIKYLKKLIKLISSLKQQEIKLVEKILKFRLLIPN